MTHTLKTEQFYMEITTAADTNDNERFKAVMLSPNFSDMSQVGKEKIAFRVAYTASEVCLDYLIFEYNIQKNDIIEAFCGINPILKKKFEMREVAIGMPINEPTKKRGMKL